MALPPEFADRPLTLTILQLPALATLRAGGSDAVDLEARTLDHYSSPGPHAWRIDREETRGRTLDLAITVERRWFESDWLRTVPRLSTTPAGDARFVFVSTFNRVTAEVALAFTLLMAFTYAFLYLLDRRRLAALWLALQGLFGCSYPILLLGISQPILGTVDVPLGAIAFASATVCSVHFMMAIARLPRPNPAWWLWVVAVGIAAAIWRDPRHTPNVPSMIAILSLFAVTARILLILGQVKLQTTTRVAVIGFPLAVLFGLPDAASLLGSAEFCGGLRGGAMSFAMVSLLQVLFLSRDHDESLRHADALNAELAERLSHLGRNNEEIRLLNDELRRQIVARSERLAEALARLGPLGAARRAFASGEVVDERYRVVRLIGEGGMGVVYQIERVSDGRVLALKVLHAARSGAELARLAREAEIASRVNHPNIVRIVDVDVAQSGALFMVMDYIDGASLDALRGRYGDVAWARSILRQLAAGLAALHAEGIVHRDLKPGNVLVAHEEAGDVVKIADFGIAMRGTETVTLDQRVVTPERTAAPRDAVASLDSGDAVTLERGAPLTQTGQILGTPVYMAPELLHGAKLANAATDVYAFGIIAREIFTGKLPEGFEALLHLRSLEVTVPPSPTPSPPSLPRSARYSTLAWRATQRCGPRPTRSRGG